MSQNSQNQAIYGDFLSKRDLSNKAIHRRSDMALQFDRKNADVATSLAKRAGNESLSPLTQRCSARRPIACGIEIKAAGGDDVEASTQMAVLSAAVLRKMRQLGLVPPEPEVPLMTIGWTVVGHSWSCYIAVLSAEGDDRVVSRHHPSLQPPASSLQPSPRNAPLSELTFCLLFRTATARWISIRPGLETPPACSRCWHA